MKDPLQTEKTPYEILDVGLDANAKDVLGALAQLMRTRPRDMRAGMQAKNVLTDPESRAVVDILHYNPRWVGSLTPSPLDDASVLLPDRRAATAKAWEQYLYQHFPDIDVTHSLAVLWYWWAFYEEERFIRLIDAAQKGGADLPDTLSKEKLLKAIRKAEGVSCNPAPGNECQNLDCPWREDCYPETHPLPVMWQRVIAYWVKLLNTAEFWGELNQGYAEIAGQVKTRFLSSLENKLDSFEKRYRQRQTPGLIVQYTELLLTLSVEDKIAKLMTKVGVRVKRHNAKMCCGTLMLQQIGILEAAQRQVDAAIKESPDGSLRNSLTSLRRALSPYFKIANLIWAKKPDEALAAIEKLPPQERETDEVLELKASALIEKAQQQADTDNVDKALDNWGEALKTTANPDIQKEAREGIVAAVKRRAAYLQRHNEDAAIDLVKRALELVDDEELKLTLSELLVIRGIVRVNKAQKMAGDDRDGAIDLCEKGWDDLKDAAKLGSAKAVEQAKVAKRILDQLKRKKPTKIGKWLEEAAEAAKKKDWDKAIQIFNRVIKELEGEPPTGFKESLAVCYSNRAVRTTNQALDIMHRDIEKWEQKVKKEFKHRSSSYKCARCGRDQYKHRYGNWYQAELPVVGKVTICEKCLEKAKKVMRERPKPNKKAVELLEKASFDLSQAEELDPKSKTVQEHIKEVDEIRSRLSGAGVQVRTAQADEDEDEGEGFDGDDAESLIRALKSRNAEERRRAAATIMYLVKTEDPKAQGIFDRVMADSEAMDALLAAMKELS